MKFFTSLLAIFYFLLATFSISLAAIEERTYLLSFRNSTSAGPAINTRFWFQIDQSISPIKLGQNGLFENSVLTLTSPKVIDPGQAWEIKITLKGPSEILDQLESQKLTFNWKDANFSGVGQVDLQRTTPQTFLEFVRSDTKLVDQIETLGVPLIIGLGILGIISLTSTVIAAGTNLALSIADFFRYLAFGFLRFKKRKPWGAVYNQITGRPIAIVLVKIFDARSKKLKETQLTDAEGRFGFLVPPGEYYIQANRHGFYQKQSDTLKIDSPESAINTDIYLISSSNDIKKRLWLIKLIHFLKYFIDAINPYVLAVGTVLSLLVALAVPTNFNFAILGIYILLDAIKIILSRQTIKSFGIVSDHEIGQPLSLAVVRIFNADKNWLLNTKVTGTTGRFNFLTTAGHYYLTAIKSGYKPFHSQALEVKKSGIINFDVKLVAEK